MRTFCFQRYSASYPCHTFINICEMYANENVLKSVGYDIKGVLIKGWSKNKKVGVLTPQHTVNLNSKLVTAHSVTQGTMDSVLRFFSLGQFYKISLNFGSSYTKIIAFKAENGVNQLGKASFLLNFHKICWVNFLKCWANFVMYSLRDRSQTLVRGDLMQKKKIIMKIF